MAANNPYDSTSGEEEHILPLSNNRQLAYAHNGPATSRTVIIFFPGLFGVGRAPRVSEACRDVQAHFIAPTLPGMGNSSTRDKSVPYHVSLARDISALLSHLYPTDAFDTLYLSGGSYGTVPAQMLYGASYELFPAGRKIAGCLLIAGFSPLKYHHGYAKTLSWQNWFSFGPPTQLLPFHLLQWLFRKIIGSHMNTQDGAGAFLQQHIFSKMDDAERSKFKQWLEINGLSEDSFIAKMACDTIRCNQNWDGFMEVSDVMHSDWGFEPKELDDEHASKPMLVVGSSVDQLGGTSNDWLVENYRSARLKLLPGGHISALFYMDELWEDLFETVMRT